MQAAYTYERVEESTELTQLKLDTKATREGERNKAKKDKNFRQAQVAQIKAHSKNNGKGTGLFKGDEHTTHRTQGKEDAQVQGHRFDTNEEPAERNGSRRRYGKVERPAQVQGHKLNTNEEPEELSGGRRRYGEAERPA